MTTTIPNDVKAYMLAAAGELMTEQNVQPDRAADWLAENIPAIAERARDKMRSLAVKLIDNPKLMAVVTEIMGRAVYQRIRATKRPAGWNPRYVAYAKAHGATPDEMLKRDGGKMTNFLCWKP
jgi:plasmid stabilization system protein ParE